MPVDGLPNPTIHRLCRRCARWHHLHEGSYIEPPAAGPVSWLLNSYQRHADPQAGQRFVCSACQVPRGPARGQRLLGTIIGLAAGALVGWWLYASGLCDEMITALFHDLLGPAGK